MKTQTQQVLEQAVGLSPIERVELVEGILSSFDFPTRAAIDAAWAQEAEDRIDAYDRGDVAAVPAAVVFERIEKKYSS
jgi:putative addiction module component (TIGR02574 family)